MKDNELKALAVLGGASLILGACSPTQEEIDATAQAARQTGVVEGIQQYKADETSVAAAWTTTPTTSPYPTYTPLPTHVPPATEILPTPEPMFDLDRVWSGYSPQNRVLGQGLTDAGWNLGSYQDFAINNETKPGVDAARDVLFGEFKKDINGVQAFGLEIDDLDGRYPSFEELVTNPDLTVTSLHHQNFAGRTVIVIPHQANNFSDALWLASLAELGSENVIVDGMTVIEAKANPDVVQEVGRRHQSKYRELVKRSLGVSNEEQARRDAGTDAGMIFRGVEGIRDYGDQEITCLHVRTPGEDRVLQGYGVEEVRFTADGKGTLTEPNSEITNFAAIISGTEGDYVTGNFTLGGYNGGGIESEGSEISVQVSPFDNCDDQAIQGATKTPSSPENTSTSTVSATNTPTVSETSTNTPPNTATRTNTAAVTPTSSRTPQRTGTPTPVNTNTHVPTTTSTSVPSSPTASVTPYLGGVNQNHGDASFNPAIALMMAVTVGGGVVRGAKEVISRLKGWSR